MTTRGAWLSLWYLLLAGLLLSSCTLPALGMESTVFAAANGHTPEMDVLRTQQNVPNTFFGELENTNRHFVIMPDKTPPVVGISHQPKDPTEVN